MRIALASERAPKVDAVRSALVRLSALDAARWGGCELVARATESGVGATPLHDDELRLGAQRRARALEAALRAESRAADLYLGLEGGVHCDSATARRAWLRSWAYAWDGTSGSFGCGPSLLLPERIAEPVLRGEDLGAVIDRVANATDVRSQAGTWGFLTRGLLPRSLAFETAVLAALARFYHPEAF